MKTEEKYELQLSLREVQVARWAIRVATNAVSLSDTPKIDAFSMVEELDALDERIVEECETEIT